MTVLYGTHYVIVTVCRPVNDEICFAQSILIREAASNVMLFHSSRTQLRNLNGLNELNFCLHSQETTIALSLVS